MKEDTKDAIKTVSMCVGIIPILVFSFIALVILFKMGRDPFSKEEYYDF